MAVLTLDLSSISDISRLQFRQIAADNPELRLERSKQGHLIIMAPTGGETGNWNSELNLEVGLWNRNNPMGKTFDSSTGFELPNGGDRSPDVSWIPLAKWEALTPEERRGFLPLCPDFVIELMSRSDSWPQMQAKMLEYMENGCRLGWLIDPRNKRVAIYRLGQLPEILMAPDNLSGEDVLPGFLLDAKFLWS
jgi:Uma2 family endonuclease